MQKCPILIFALKNQNIEIEPRSFRNAINEVGRKQGQFNGILVTATKKSTKNNLVLHCALAKAKQHLIQNPQLLGQVQTTKILEDNTWFKVAVHGISTKEFDNLDSPELLKQEFQTYNNLKVVGTPFWLSTPEVRATKQGGSMLIAFETEAEAQRAIRTPVYIAGVSVKVEKARDKQRPSQSKDQQLAQAQIQAESYMQNFLNRNQSKDKQNSEC